MSLDNKVVDLADLKVSHDYLLGQDELLSDRINELGSGIDGVESTIGDLSNLSTTQKDNIVNAINEVLQTGGKVKSVNGKTGDVVLKTSDLTNDSGYLTSYTETDPTVPSWAKQQQKPSYTASEVGAATTEALTTEINTRTVSDAQLQSQITALGNGAPIPVETVAEMIDNTKAYLYTGAEIGWLTGYWYTYDSAQAKFIPRGEYGVGTVIDDTLTVTGDAADAKATGDAISEVRAQIPGVDASLATAGKAADAKATGDALATVNGRLTQAETDLSPLIEGVEDITSELEVTPLERVNSTTGEVAASTTYSATGYVPIDGRIYYKIEYGRIAYWKSSNDGMAFYDENKDYISGQNFIMSSTDTNNHRYEFLDVPENARYARFTIRPNSTTPFKLVLYSQSELEKIKTDLRDVVCPMEFCPAGLYELSSVDYDDMTTASGVYAKYDALMEETGVTRELIGYGSDANGEPDETLPIYAYTIASPMATSAKTFAPKILLSSGVHGGERTAVVGLYNFIKTMFTRNAIAWYIHNEFNIKVIPVCNPGGFNAAQRNNLHGVDIDRNFGYNWTSGSDHGTEAYSEPETQAVRSWLAANTDALMYIDCHNHNKSDGIYYTATEFIMHRKAWSFMYNALINRFATEYNVDMTAYPRIWERNTIAGAASEASQIYGIDASILETYIGTIATHARSTAEVTGNFILCLLRNYKV